MAGDAKRVRGVGVCRAAGLGAGALVPGYWQCRWGQARRGLALGGMVASMIGVAALGWGTPLALAMVAGAFLVHVRSASDALSQASFPGFARGVPALSMAMLLALGVYLPVLGVAWSMAWTGRGGGPDGVSYLVNRLAFREEAPEPGDWVCYRGGPEEGRGVGVGRVVAREGDELEWRGDGVRVGQEVLGWMPKHDGRTASLSMEVPPGFLLVAPLRPGVSEANSPGLILVESQEVLGRAWAQAYPIWSRRLLL